MIKVRIFIACLILTFAANTAFAAKRVALVIGNNSYTSLPKLANAERDARDMAKKLAGLGFEVIARYNASERQMIRALRKFGAALESGGTGLMFYAGHGIQAQSKNFLIPADAEIEVEEDLYSEAVDANEILRVMKRAGNNLNIMIIDACRDNPLPRASRSSARGLAITNVPSGAKGTAIIYAAGPGQTAQDGAPGENGIFTGALLEFMDKPGWSLERILKATSAKVLKRTNNKQRPWQLVSMQGDFIFNKNKPTKPAVAAAQSANDLAAQFELTFWNSVKNSQQPAEIMAYLQRYPKGAFAPLARAKLNAIERQNKQEAVSRKAQEETRRKQSEQTARELQSTKEKELWQATVAMNDTLAFQEFLKLYPDSVYKPLAEARIKSLADKQIARLSKPASTSQGSGGTQLDGVTKNIDGAWEGLASACWGDPGFERNLRIRMKLSKQQYRIEILREGSNAPPEVRSVNSGTLPKQLGQKLELENNFSVILTYDEANNKFKGTLDWDYVTNDCVAIISKIERG